jgi:beta-galactosidase
MKISYLIVIALLYSLQAFAQSANSSKTSREHINIDTNWSFALGHAYDAQKDFGNGTSYFSYLAKASYGDGAAAAGFDDRAWRKLDLPHDWAVEADFSANASFSHGFKTVGRNYPEKSVGWYRKKINITKNDLGRRITIAFDGVFRNSIVWLNGHYLGTEPSGYNGFEYDITDLLNYDGENTIAVRVDATMEEGWFYEGAGIYRHVWLNKSSPVHISTNGTFVSTTIKGGAAWLNVKTRVNNDGKITSHFVIEQKVYDAEGRLLAKKQTSTANIAPYKQAEYSSEFNISNPKLWSVDVPYLHRLVTTVLVDGAPIDECVTRFGIRTIKFDANSGFYLNGKHLEIKGTNNHQEHAGVGTAMPDELQYFRIAKLKEMGSNAYRCSHNPPTMELLDACDSLGMLVIDENRLMGINDYHLGNLKKLIERDRNHPSVISWSIGNEEWGIENNITGTRIAETMQAFVKSLDTTRAITAAFSGGWGQGLSAVVDLIGYNYIAQENPDAQHQKFPEQKGWGTEEGSTFSTRGIYLNNDSLHYKSAYDAKPRPNAYSIEEGWNYYIKRPFLAGMFIWTGFDYRGEPTPYNWPSTGSYFGMLDQCGFSKDVFWYLRSWWANKPVLHLLPHWNWKGKEGQVINVWAYSNCQQVELFLNGKSQGKKSMPNNGHLEWGVNYEPGTLMAVGYTNGIKVLTDVVKTTNTPLSISLVPHKETIKADRKDIAIITVSMADEKGLFVPDAANEISFKILGPGKIIGVGNGDPTSIEPDKYLDKTVNIPIDGLMESPATDTTGALLLSDEVNTQNWRKAFSGLADTSVKKWVYRGKVILTKEMADSALTLFYSSIGRKQTIYFNEHLLASNVDYQKDGSTFTINKGMSKEGLNTLTVVALPIRKQHDWDVVNTNPGLVQFKVSAGVWKRKLFNGLAQVIVQSTHSKQGNIKLTASAKGLSTSVLLIKAK